MLPNKLYHRFARLVSLFFVAILLCGLVLIVESVPVAQAATFNIADGDVAGLIAAINTANSNGQANIINLAANGTYTLTTINNVTTGNNGLPPISSNLTINGNGAKIIRFDDPATPYFRILFITATANLTLNNLTISGGNNPPLGNLDDPTGYAGGIFNNNGKLKLYKSILSQNAGAFKGGAIYNSSGGTVELVESTLDHNNVFATLTSTVRQRGGGIFNSGTVSIINSTISNNNANYKGVAGGIANEGFISITGSTISNNFAYIPFATSTDEILSNDGSLNISSSVVSPNAITGGNLAITITNSTIAQIIGSNLTITNSNLGFVYANGTLSVTNSTLAVIANFGAATIKDSTLHYDPATFIGTKYASWITNNPESAMTIVNSTMVGSLGLVYDVDAKFISNSGKSLDIINSTIVATNTGGSTHPALENLAGTTTLRNTIISTTNMATCSGTIVGSNNLEYPGPTASCGSGSMVAATNPLSAAGLANNGGPTQTIALAPRPNPAIDTASAAYCPPTDQRGVARPIGGGCDIGAFEASQTPTLTTAFAPSKIVSGGTSTLSFSLSNPNSLPLTNVSFTDNLPAQLTIANPAAILNNCGGGTVSALAGSSIIGVSGVSLSANQKCSISVNVTSTTLGSWSNTTGPISAAETGADATSNTATLQVLASLVVTTTSDDANSPAQGSLRQVLSVAAGQNGAVVTFDPSLGTHPQITLAVALVVPANVLVEASCTNKVQINANFANAVQLQGNSFIQGLQIHSPVSPILKLSGHGNELKCVTVSRN